MASTDTTKPAAEGSANGLQDDPLGSKIDSGIAADTILRQSRISDPLADLARMSISEYGIKRPALAKQVGIPPSMLDKEYYRARAQAKRDEAKAQQDKEVQAAGAWAADPEPWPSTIKGPDLLAEIAKVFDRFVVMPPNGSDVAALWAVGTHAVRHFRCFPFFALTSP